jgi:exodeoxyribonuclease VII small subunit
MTSKDFEKKIEKSKETLNKLMAPDITLAESMKLYKSGIKELKDAQEMLEKAKIEFQEISSNSMDR